MRKLTIEFVKKEIEKFGYKCLSKEYVGVHFKLVMKCDEGHIYIATWCNFKHGTRCPMCSGYKKRTIEEIQEYIKKFGYKCLSKKYINNSTKLRVKCNKNHTFEMSWANFKSGQRCPQCAGNKKKTIEEVKVYAESINYKCLSNTCVGAHEKLSFTCNNNHMFIMSWNHISRERRCPICSIENRRKNYSEKDRKNILLYKKEVIQLTNINYKLHKDIINPNKLKRGRNKYHLDHIYSIMDGFNNNVGPNIIASPVNLRMLLEKDNISKNGNSHMTLDQLFSLHEQFLRETN